MKRWAMMCFVVIVAACGKDSTGPSDTNAYLKIQNSSVSTIEQVYYSDCANTLWGPERLAGSVILSGQSRTFTVAPGCWDIKTIDAAAFTAEFNGHTVAAGQTFTATVTN